MGGQEKRGREGREREGGGGTHCSEYSSISDPHRQEEEDLLKCPYLAVQDSKNLSVSRN